MGVAIPVLPLDTMASWARFSPECRSDEPDCELTGLTLDANFRIPVPLIHPYVSAGIAYRRLSPVQPGEEAGALGPGLGAGVDVALARLHLFGEARYEWVDAPADRSSAARPPREGGGVGARQRIPPALPRDFRQCTSSKAERSPLS